MQGEANREIVRIAFECSLREPEWNPYYGALLQNVLAASKAHAKTAQFCLWDQLKALKQQEMSKARILACLAAHLITAKALPLSVLRVCPPSPPSEL